MAKEKQNTKTEKEEEGEIIEINESTEELENEGIEISSDVIGVIAGVAVSEIEGVAGMAGSFAGGITEVLSGKKNLAKGIKVDINGQKVKLDINIIVEYGTRIPDIAYKIQKRVKTSVETMTGLSVDEVNVHVQGVNTDSTEAESEEKEEK